MVPHVAARGSSFKGAGLYYLHDKSADTSERVDWTLTHNVPTHDPDKALKWMTYTAIHADKIKRNYGGSKVGRKSAGKPVYTYSLSWHKDDQPTREEMQEAVFETLDRLDLKEHEVLIVAHKDTDHPHVHVICNLVNPTNGRIHTARLDHNKLSRWAQEHDERFGRTHCSERIKNNHLRTKEAQFIKHRPKEDPRAQMISNLYNQSDNGKAFKAALQEQGYTLAQGHKGRITLVNEEGQVFSLARQLKGQRARDIKARLKDIDFKSLPIAKDLADERLYFDRDKYAQQQQDKIEAAGIEAEKKRLSKEQTASDDPIAQYDDRHLKALDELQKWEAKADIKRYQLEDQLEKTHRHKKMLKQRQALEKQLKEKKSVIGRITGKYKALSEKLTELNLTIEHSEVRMREARQALENKLAETKPPEFKHVEQSKEPNTSNRPTRQQRINYVRKQKSKYSPKKSRGRDHKSNELGL